MATDFIAELEQQVPDFLEQVDEALPFVKPYYADHVCWRTETKQEYSDLISSLKNYSRATLLIESIIGGRPIATFKLHDGIMCCSDRRSISVLEIPSPKEGSPYPRGLEHVEFAIGLENLDASPITPINDATHQYRLQTLMEEHPEIKSWNVKAKCKKINPDVSLKIELPTFGNCSVKFHLLPLESVIEYESAHEMA